MLPVLEAMAVEPVAYCYIQVIRHVGSFIALCAIAAQAWVEDEDDVTVFVNGYLILQFGIEHARHCTNRIRNIIYLQIKLKCFGHFSLFISHKTQKKCAAGEYVFPSCVSRLPL